MNLEKILIKHLDVIKRCLNFKNEITSDSDALLALVAIKSAEARADEDTPSKRQQRRDYIDFHPSIPAKALAPLMVEKDLYSRNTALADIRGAIEAHRRKGK